MVRTSAICQKPWECHSTSTSCYYCKICNQFHRKWFEIGEGAERERGAYQSELYATAGAGSSRTGAGPTIGRATSRSLLVIKRKVLGFSRGPHAFAGAGCGHCKTRNWDAIAAASVARLDGVSTEAARVTTGPSPRYPLQRHAERAVIACSTQPSTANPSKSDARKALRASNWAPKGLERARGNQLSECVSRWRQPPSTGTSTQTRTAYPGGAFPAPEGVHHLSSRGSTLARSRTDRVKPPSRERPAPDDGVAFIHGTRERSDGRVDGVAATGGRSPSRSRGQRGAERGDACRRRPAPRGRVRPAGAALRRRSRHFIVAPETLAPARSA